MGFLTGSGAAIASALVLRARVDVSRLLQSFLAVGLGALPILRVMTGGAGWPSLIAAEQLIPMMIDTLFVCAGLCVFLMSRQPQGLPQPSSAPVSEQSNVALMPAE
jgi:hypothetical protein